MPKAGGATEMVLSTGSSGGTLQVDPTRLYWDESPNFVFSAPLDGSSSPVRIANAVQDWTVGSDGVYYFTGYDLFRVGPTGGTPILLLPGVSTGAEPAADGVAVYWGPGGDAGAASMRAFALAGGHVANFAPAVEVPFVHADGSHVFWVDEPGYLGLATIWAAGPDGAQPHSIARGQLGVLGLTSDGTSVYWVTSDGKGALGTCTVWGATLPNGPPRIIACGLNGFLYGGLAVDATDVYFSTYGAVVRVPKGS
jgi:hypothetical protein